MSRTGTPGHGDADLKNLLRALSAARVEFVICGGVACVLHGVSRVTNDIDLLVRLEDANLTRFVDVLRQFQFVPRIPEPLEAVIDAHTRQRWIKEKGARVITFNSRNSPLQVDMFLDYPFSYDEVAARSVRMPLADITVSVSSVKDLIDAKRSVDPPRKVDLRDIEDLEELLNDERDERPA